MTRLRRLIAGALGIAGVAGLAPLVGGSPAQAEQGDTGSEFAPIYRVLESPRCVNCHPSGDAPHVGDEGRRHRMNVSRRSADAGLPCSTCHRARNAGFEHGPPGALNWQMPPADHPMPFEQRSAHEVCEQLKDPKRNGGKSLADLHAHFATDSIVLWGWDPGPGRTKPPIPHAELVQRVDAWIAAGAPCPREKSGTP
jgi:hypothetical protein